MISPSWLAYVLAAVVIAVALFSAARLVAARGRRRRCEVDADSVHVVMGIAMAGMFVPGLAVLPGGLWAVIFAAGAAWFGWRAIRVRRLAAAHTPAPTSGAMTSGPAAAAAAAYPARRSRWARSQPAPAVRRGPGRDCCPFPVPHLIDCLAMVYALVAVPAIVATSAPQASGGTGGGMAVMSHGGDMASAGGARVPVIGLILAILVCGYIVWLADRIQRHAAAPGAIPAAAGAAALLAPRTATCCKIAMGVAMGVMLIDLL